MSQSMKQQVEQLRFSSQADRIVRDISHASVLVFVVTAVVAGIMASISLSSELGIGVTASFLVVGILFPLLCGWLWKEQWRARKVEQKLRSLGPHSAVTKGTTVAGDDSPVGLLILTPDLRVHFANQAYLQGTHHEAEDILGWKIQDVLPADGIEGRVQAVLRHPDPAASCCFSALMGMGPGGERPVHITITRIAPQQEHPRVLVIVEDLPLRSSHPGPLEEGYIC